MCVHVRQSHSNYSDLVSDASKPSDILYADRLGPQKGDSAGHHSRVMYHYVLRYMGYKLGVVPGLSAGLLPVQQMSKVAPQRI